MERATDELPKSKSLLQKCIIKLKTDRFLQVFLILFILLLSLSFFMQYAIGANTLNTGTILHEESNQTLENYTFKVFTVNFTLDYHAFVFGSSNKIDVYLLYGNYTREKNLNVIISIAFQHKLKTDSWSYWFQYPFTYSIVLVNFNTKGVQYSLSIRDYTSTQYQEITINDIGHYIIYFSFLPIVLYAEYILFRKYHFHNRLQPRKDHNQLSDETLENLEKFIEEEQKKLRNSK